MTDPIDSIDPVGAGPEPAAPESATTAALPKPDQPPRPILERIGMAAVAIVIGAMFALVGVAAFLGGEPFLGVMGVIGCLMVLWVGGLTLFKGR